MSIAGPPNPGYEFSDHPDFEASKDRLDLDDFEIDEHMWAIENMLLDGPIEWSVALPSNPGLRVAISDSTEYSPVALRLIFRVRGYIIERLHVERR